MPEGSCCDDEEHCGRQHFDPSIVFEVDLGASPATVEVVRAGAWLVTHAGVKEPLIEERQVRLECGTLELVRV